MKENKLSIIRKEILIGFIMLLCINSISAFVVSSTYWSGNSLQLTPGGTESFTIILQNGGTSNLNIKAIISSGSEILRLTDSSDIYTVPAGGRATINLQAVIPDNAKPGTIYPAKIDFTEIVSGAGGTVFGTSIGQSFDIVVLGGNNSFPGTSLVLYILGAMIVLLIIALAIVKLKKKKHKLHKHKKR